MKERGYKTLALIPLDLDGYFLGRQWKVAKPRMCLPIRGGLHGWDGKQDTFEQQLTGLFWRFAPTTAHGCWRRDPGYDSGKSFKWHAMGYEQLILQVFTRSGNSLIPSSERCVLALISAGSVDDRTRIKVIPT